jgi:hypothetical protein
MNFSLKEEALRKLICCFKDKFDNHTHNASQIEGLSDLVSSGKLKATWDSSGNVTLLGSITVSHDGLGNVSLM